MHIHNKIITLSFLTKILLYFCLYTTYTYSMDKGYSNLFTGPCTIERIQRITYNENYERCIYTGHLPDSVLRATYNKKSGRIEVIRKPFYNGITINCFTYEDESWYETLKKKYK